MLGAISPNADWIKEGMEFDEDEVSLRNIIDAKINNGIFDEYEWYVSKAYLDGEYKHYSIIKDYGIIAFIQGHCGHFH